MDEKLQNILFEKYPNLFENKNKSVQESCMAWGLEIGDGWYDIISNVCVLIEKHSPDVRFDQIKEKFGGLRIYYSGGSDYVQGVVDLAEELSYKTCEVCGNKGEPNKTGWIRTLCKDHE